ncbi:MAG: hypothetical protein CMG35_11290 [Candidatus Marinimicrobia bacterium]|nr:hypothetical protein [Candidatus Neomarinimicrobiota bacterium]|tara:strand:+ start:3821 stop:4066 length:246 start_codon:yes stop_codon:yes gene_type:complete
MNIPNFFKNTYVPSPELVKTHIDQAELVASALEYTSKAYVAAGADIKDDLAQCITLLSHAAKTKFDNVINSKEVFIDDSVQ